MLFRIGGIASLHNRSSHSPRAPLPTSALRAVAHEDYAQVPEEGNGAVVEAIRHMLEFALELLDAGNLDDVVNSEYVQSLPWYKSLPTVLS